MTEEIPSGTLVDNRYRIERVLGQGGFGRTYLAADTRRFDEPCVLKEFVPSGSGEAVIQKSRELFQREAKTLYQLSHPQIPRFHAQVEERGRLFLVQDYVQGQTYYQLLRQRLQQGRPFSEAEIRRWLRHLLPVLGYIHDQDIVHRDISPDNIMLPNGESLPVLIDFGVVKQALTQCSVSDGASPASFVGKVGYAPTEQIRMGKCFPSSDLYALGVTALVLLTGREPNQLMDAQTLEWGWQSQVTLSDALVQVLNRMLAEKPTDRYPSAAAVLAELALPPDTISFSAAEPGGNVASEPVAPSIVAAPGSSESLVVEPITAEPIAGTDLSLPEAIEPDSEAIEPDSEAIAKTDLSLSEATGSDRVTAVRSSAEPQQQTQRAPRMTMGRSRWFWGTVAAVALAVLGGGVGLAVRVPYIPFLCKPLDNCARDREFAKLYQRAIDQAKSAQLFSANPQSIDDLESAETRLESAIATLETIPSDTKVYAEVQQTLPNYQQQFDDIQARIEQEVVAQQQIENSEVLVQTAIEHTKTAKSAETIASYETAKTSWKKVLTSLKAIDPTSLVASQAQTKLQTYQQEMTAIEEQIATLQAAIAAEAAARARAEAAARARAEAAARQNSTPGYSSSGQSPPSGSSSRSQSAPPQASESPPPGPPLW